MDNHCTFKIWHKKKKEYINCKFPICKNQSNLTVCEIHLPLNEIGPHGKMVLCPECQDKMGEDTLKRHLDKCKLKSSQNKNKKRKITADDNTIITPRIWVKNSLKITDIPETIIQKIENIVNMNYEKFNIQISKRLLYDERIISTDFNNIYPKEQLIGKNSKNIFQEISIFENAKNLNLIFMNDNNDENGKNCFKINKQNEDEDEDKNEDKNENENENEKIIEKEKEEKENNNNNNNNNNRNNNIIVELGCGAAELSKTFQIGCKNHSSHILIDRMQYSSKNKFDKDINDKLKKLNQSKGLNNFLIRDVIDIKDMTMTNYIKENQEKEENNKIIFISKHLCGNALDLSIDKIISYYQYLKKKNITRNNKVSMIVATCCHYLLNSTTYCNFDYIQEILNITREEFDYMIRLTSWGTLKDTESNHYKLGKKIKYILDKGRCEFLKSHGFKNVEMVEYIDSTYTKENTLIIAYN
ncbi:hypothetical protein BCR32DRAFT_272332 [Anaeromyces robustus]|uniref:tRNA:m(4)X modification enzyme TRM13 n=1 Tax=Anaeromyces robustus TaxID=1754192 RepID=A0A1Y1WCI4_9FUNG|nr:hypothetical protein BCR32DRAFT_272332 [Anaeromyces robustus]|eukprot:ORX71038.1 hypothetical protein BCR32DRAFT_272332 [Anaeromyces robustus]